MTTLSTTNSAIILERIYTSLYKRNFADAEYILISLVEHLFNTSQKGEIKVADIELIQNLYSNFNQLYLTWIEEQQRDTEKEIDELAGVEHDNFLINQCNDPAAVDDLMFELLNYFTDHHKIEQKQEVEYHLNCYKKYLSA